MFEFEEVEVTNPFTGQPVPYKKRLAARGVPFSG
jgi:hypothetical protein